MKKVLGKITSFTNKVIWRMEKVTKEPAEFLGDGKTGGMVMCTLLTTLFLYGCIFRPVSCLIPAPIIGIILFVMLVLLTELTAILFKLIFGGGNRSRFYFSAAWLGLAVAFLIGTQLHNIPSGIIISFLVALSVDIFGRCVFGFIKTRKFKQVFGYIALVTSTMLIILFALFFCLDSFGDNRIEKYLAIES